MVRRVTLDDAAVHRVVETIPYVAQDPPTQGALSTCVVECRISMIRITIVVECRVSITRLTILVSASIPQKIGT